MEGSRAVSDLDLETKINFRPRFPAGQAPVFSGNFIEHDLDVIGWNSYFSEATNHRLVQIAFGLKRTAGKGTYGPARTDRLGGS